MEPRLPQNETVYKVAGLFGADNEPEDHWETVGQSHHILEDAVTEMNEWQNNFPDRLWVIMRAVTTWEHIE